jgi:hypothetical protein
MLRIDFVDGGSVVPFGAGADQAGRVGKLNARRTRKLATEKDVTRIVVFVQDPASGDYGSDHDQGGERGENFYRT